MGLAVVLPEISPAGDAGYFLQQLADGRFSAIPF
jgi:hypothetical protein